MSKNHAVTGDHVAVVGGGIIGAMSAWFLTEAGFRVTIIDRNQFGAACSRGNCGYVCPSSVLPLSQPGAIAKTLRAMLKPNSPFAIKPQLSPSFLSWFWNFYRQCNSKDMLETAASVHSLLQSSMSLYKGLITAENINCEWQEAGLLYVYDNEREFLAYESTDKLLRGRFGVGATPYDGEQLTRLEPAIKPGFGGAWHYEGDCHLRPDKLMDELRAKLEGRGVQIIESMTIDGFVREGRSAKAVSSGGQAVDADAFVVATGAMTPFLNDHLGLKVPIQPGKGYSLTMPCPSNMPRHPMIFEDSHVAITPMQSGYRIGSTMEFVGYDTSINPKRLGLLTAAAEKYLHDPYSDPIEDEWFGWRPMVWDGKPIIGPSPAMDNVWLACGHSMLGLSMATGSGLLLTEMMSGTTPHLDPEPFSAFRFA